MSNEQNERSQSKGTPSGRAGVVSVDDENDNDAGTVWQAKGNRSESSLPANPPPPAATAEVRARPVNYVSLIEDALNRGDKALAMKLANEQAIIAIKALGPMRPPAATEDADPRVNSQGK